MSNRIKVRLISFTKNPEENVVAAIRQCYSNVGASELKKKTDEKTRKKLIKMVVASGHTSTIEHASFTFAIEGISRITEVQMIRHRVGTSYSIQSGRYVKRNKVGYVIPESIRKSDKKVLTEYKKVLKQNQDMYEKLLELGIKAEDARYIQPQSLSTKMVVTMNARALLNFFRLRCCTRAQWEIRQMANLMLLEVKKVAPIIFGKAGATCVSEGICFEGDMSCGAWKGLKGELRKR